MAAISRGPAAVTSQVKSILRTGSLDHTWTLLISLFPRSMDGTAVATAPRTQPSAPKRSTKDHAITRDVRFDNASPSNANLSAQAALFLDLIRLGLPQHRRSCRSDGAGVKGVAFIRLRGSR